MVILTHGYFLAEDPKERSIMRPYPPLGLLYLSGWLEVHGVAHEVFDTTFSTMEALQARLLENPPRVLALYVNLMTKVRVLALIRWVREQESLKNALIVLGGPDVSYNLELYLQHGADLIVVGEGEQTLLEIVQAEGDFSQIPGIAFRLPDGSVFKTKTREKIRDLDQLPLPNRLKINLNLYLEAWKKAHGQSAVSLSTQRGCPYTCQWCSTAVYGQSYRRRSPAKVVEEIIWLLAHYDFDLIWFVDDVFTVSHKWLSEFRDQLQEKQVRILFECITRADRLTEEVIQVLKEAGCFRVWIGAESGSQRIIDAMDRRVEVGQVRAMIRAASTAGIETGTFIMLGYPGETEADIRETVRHLQEANPDLFTITVAYPIKGTGLYESVKESITARLPWENSSDRDLEFQRTYSRRYYDYAVRWTVNAVHWHKAKLSGNALSWPGVKALGKMMVARAGMYCRR